MVKLNFEYLNRPWFVPIVVGAFVAMGMLLNMSRMAVWDRVLYDSATSMSYRGQGATKDIVLVEYGAEDLAVLSAFPGARSNFSSLIRRLSLDGAQAVALAAPLNEILPATDVSAGIRTALESTDLRNSNPTQWRSLEDAMVGLKWRADGDAQLRAAMAAYKKTYLGFDGSLLASKASADAALKVPPSRINLAAGVPAEFGDEGSMALWQRVLSRKAPALPAQLFANEAAGVGYYDIIADTDGVVRSQPLALKFDGQWYPSFSVLLAAAVMSVPVDQISIGPDKIRLGQTVVQTDGSLHIYPAFRWDSPETPVFTRYALRDVLFTPAAGRFKGKLVLIGPAANLSPSRAITPMGMSLTPMELHGQLAASLINADYFRLPRWVSLAGWGMLILAIAIGAGLALLPQAVAVLSGLMSTLLLLAVAFYAILGAGVFIPMMGAVIVVLCSSLAVLRPREAESAVVNNRHDPDKEMFDLGQQHLKKGRFDLAFEMFKKLDPIPEHLDATYEVALEFEKQGRYEESLAVYEHILKHRASYKDAAERHRRAAQLLKNQNVRVGGGLRTLRVDNSAPEGPTDEEKTMIFRPGGSGMVAQGAIADVKLPSDSPTQTAHTASSVSMGGGSRIRPEDRTSLGRYRIQGKLGQGAMGLVYKAIDPKINRVVALKTMALELEFDPEEAQEVKMRFFNEAEVAGRLNHPHIVTIYDANEEDGLAYIAMEYLDGTDMRQYGRKDKLLPVNKVMELAAQIAEALDYAHKQGVVHRDIKPSNIILDATGRNVKVVDFGIARIGTGSKTKTGVVLGTPPYMSPEQLSGKTVDGRSDIFSLGILLFELLSGQRPFDADSVTTLMVKIAKDPHPDISTLRGGIPVCMRNIIDKALEKDPNKRYQTGGALRLALMRCIGNNYLATGKNSVSAGTGNSKVSTDSNNITL